MKRPQKPIWEAVGNSANRSTALSKTSGILPTWITLGKDPNGLNTETPKALKAGDIVLVKSPAPKKRKNYPLGLIVEMRTSPDGYSRQALVRMANYQSLNKQILNRKENWRKFYGFTKNKPLESIPIQRLYPLEGVHPLQKDIIESALTQTWCASPLGRSSIENFHFTMDFNNPSAPRRSADLVDTQQFQTSY